jgi:P-type Mg2+ transporter
VLAFELLHLFLNPLVIILLVASAISAFLGQKIEAELIFVIVIFSVTIDFVQTYRSQRAIQRLQEHVSLTATALRDSQWQEIKRQEIVPGDIVRLSAGDLVPADGQLLEARDLYVQQAALTGESMPAEKQLSVGGQVEEKSPLARDLVFLGTSVVSGTGVARMVATGSHTAFGAIAARLADRPEETEFQRGLRRFGLLITRTVFFLVLFILVVRIAMHKDAFESFVFAVALAVGLTPEFLPMITSVTLGRGAIRMARNHVIVKHLPAIQYFGTIDVFCSDKTGTLTTGEMILDSSVDYLGHPSDRPLALAYINSKFETGIRSPLELAILKNERPDADAYLKCDEVPFDFERRRLTIVVKEKNTTDNNAGLLIVKGAPEGILELSSSYESEGHVAPLDANLRNRCRLTFDDLSSKGFRLLAVAYREVDPGGRFSARDEHSLVLAGYLAFADPPSPDAAVSVAAMKRDGIDVKILTGDNELVARHVCEQVGIENPGIMLGEELESTSDTALEHRAEETTVFARVTPMQKHRIIHALKRRGHVVG